MPPWLYSLVAKTLAQLIARKVELLWVFLSPVLSGMLFYFHTDIAPHLSDPTGWLTLKAIALSAALFPLPFAAYFWFRPKFESTDFGVHKNIKTGAYFCSPCLIQNKIHSPMYLSSDGRFWRCHSNNNHKKVNPDFKEPDQQPSPPPHARSWMA